MYIPTREDIVQLDDRFKSLSDKVNLKEKQFELDELKTRQQDPLFWNEPDKAKSISKRIVEIIEFNKDYNELCDCVAICDLYFDKEPMNLSDDEISSVYEKCIDLLVKFEMFNIFTEDGDLMSCALKITAGAGGTEAQNWTWMLMRMYVQFCDSHGFVATILDFNGAVSDKLIKSVTI